MFPDVVPHTLLDCACHKKSIGSCCMVTCMLRKCSCLKYHAPVLPIEKCSFMSLLDAYL